MQFPIIHLNGTSKKELLEKYERVYRDITTLLDSLYNANPNGRDYYPLGENAFNYAKSEHNDRIQKLMSIREEIELIYNYIENIGNEE